MGEITLQQDQVAPLTQEITLQQDQVDPLTREISLASELKYIRLQQIKHSRYTIGDIRNGRFTEYVYGGQLCDTIEGSDVLAQMLKIAKKDLAPITTFMQNVYGTLEVLIENYKMAYRPLPKRQHTLLMNVFAQSEYWYELIMEHKRKLMDDPTVSFEWKQNAHTKYLAETKNCRPPPLETHQPQATTKRTSLFRWR